MADSLQLSAPVLCPVHAMFAALTLTRHCVVVADPLGISEGRATIVRSDSVSHHRELLDHHFGPLPERGSLLGSCRRRRRRRRWRTRGAPAPLLLLRRGDQRCQAHSLRAQRQRRTLRFRAAEGWHRDACELGNSWEYVHVLRVALSYAASLPWQPEEQRNVVGVPKGRVLAPLIVLAKRPSVIAPEGRHNTLRSCCEIVLIGGQMTYVPKHHDGVVYQGSAIQRSDDISDERVGVA
jgi:hypothetical protein